MNSTQSLNEEKEMTTKYLVSSLNQRLDILDLYTTEMFDEELFLARRYMVPWRFRLNRKLSEKWKLIYQKVMYEEFLVSLEETLAEHYQNHEHKILLDSLYDDKEINIDRSNSIAGQVVCNTKPIVGQATLYCSRLNKTAIKSDSREHVNKTIAIVASDTSETVHVSNDLDHPTVLTVNDKDGYELSPNKGELFQTLRPLSESCALDIHKMPSGGSQRDKGCRQDMSHLKKTRLAPSHLQKRLDDIIGIYQARESISDVVNMRTLQRLEDLKKKIEVTEQSNKLIQALRSAHAQHRVAK
nr:hypothetical protein BgiMline_031233 [Biomphalaria glabrata]